MVQMAHMTSDFAHNIQYAVFLRYRQWNHLKTWNDLQRSLKVIRNVIRSSLASLDHLHLIRDRKSKLHLFLGKNTWNDLEGQSRSLTMAQFNKPHICHFLLVICSNHVSILYRFWDIQSFLRYSTTATVRQRLEASLRHAQHSGFYPG